MKKETFVRLFVLAIVAAGIIAPTLANPILSHKYTADPQPIVWNNRLYVYASNDDQSIDTAMGYLIQAYTLVSTDDMANWVDHGEVFRVPRDWNRGNATTARAYAPGAAVRDGKVFLYPCGAGGPVGVVTADRPEGPFNDVHNGRALADRGSWCINCNVPWLFDPAAFVDDDGQAYLYYGGGQDTSRGIYFGENFRVMKLNNDMISLRDSIAVTIIAPRSFEAAYMHKRGSTYYFSYVNDFTGSDAHPNATIMYMTGTDPMGPFTFRGPVLRNPSIGSTNINRGNNNHHGIVEYAGRWYMFYHDRRVANANGVPSYNANQRNISVDSLVYNADGTMKEVVVTHDGVAQIKYFNPYDTIRATTINRQSGIKTDEGDGGMIVTSIAEGRYIRLKGVDFGAGAAGFTVRAASGSAGGSIDLRTGSATGPLIGTCNITSTGGWNNWRDFECGVDVSGSAGVKDFLYLVFRGAGEPFRLSRYQFHRAPTGPDENGYFFHHTFEDGTTQGWAGRFGATVVNTSDQKANGSRSLFVSGRAETWQGAAYNLSALIFVPGNEYSFSALAMYAEGAETGTFKLTMQYHLDGEVEYDQVALVEARRGQWIILENTKFLIPAGATGIILYIEMPDSETADFYIDDAMGGIAGAEAPGREGVTSVRNTDTARRGVSSPVTVRARTLTVNESPETAVRIRVVSLTGKTVASFNTKGGSTLSLKKIPAGLYIIEAQRACDGVKTTSNVILR